MACGHVPAHRVESTLLMSLVTCGWSVAMLSASRLLDHHRVDEAVLLCFTRTHEVVAIRILLDAVERLPARRFTDDGTEEGVLQVYDQKLAFWRESVPAASIEELTEATGLLRG